MALADLPGIAELAFDLGARRLEVVHTGAGGPLLAAIGGLGMDASIECSEPVAAAAVGSDALGNARAGASDSPVPPGSLSSERSVLVAVLAINAAMFVVELFVGLWAESTGLVADSLDMLADAGVYAVALAAVGGAHVSQRRSARASGWIQLGLAALVLVEVARHALTGSEPMSAAMIGVGALALAANLACVVLLSRHRRGGVHLRASWIFTTNDALANAGVIVAGLLVALTGSPLPDLLMGAAIALLVASGAVRILRMSR